MGRTLAAGTTTVSEVGNLRFRQPDTTYAFGELAYSAALPTGWWLDCTVSGTTSASPLTFVSAPTVGAVVADGTVEWTVRRPFTGSNLVHHCDVITSSGTYTAPVTGLYKITVKGGGGGGGASRYVSGSTLLSGGGGGEGGTLVVVKHLEAGTEVSVIVGAGGRKGKFVTSTTIPDASKATSGGDTSISIEGNPFSYVAGGGKGATFVYGAAGGSCSTTDTDISNVTGINGCPGNLGQSATSGSVGWELRGGSGGGAGGAVGTGNGVNGGGGGGGMTYTTSSYQKDGGAGGDGYVWFEYFDTVLNPRSS